MPGPTDYLMDTMLSQASSTVGVLAPAATYLGVASTITDRGDQTVMANVVPCTGGLSLPKAIGSWTGPARMNDGRAVIDAPAIEFGVTVSSDNQAVGGWYLTNATVGGTLLAYNVFPVPFLLTQGGAALGIVLRITLDPNGRWSAEVVYNG